ncbi:amidase [Pseudoalteromonas piscicida]|uniref:amidase n=1 Tax=Pseudoalteromonas piscicida TaxID=43662 RepID=UPI0032BF8EF9
MKKSLLALTTCLALALPAYSQSLADLTTLEVQTKIQNQTLSATQLTEFYLKRIAQLDDSGPMLNAVITLNPNALQDAKKLDDELLAGKYRGPLHGLPVIVKDNIDTRAPMATTAGALALQHNVKTQAAPLIIQLEQAGAIILGKANLSEWANFKSSFSSSGYSTLGGQTKNPYVLDRTPCGSSSGSAVAVSAGLALLAIGTETDGSIVCPSAHNGVVGIKPTVGLVSGEGIIPISHSQDSAGPMAKSVMGAALLLNAIVTDAKQPIDFTQGLNTASFKGKRIAITSHVGQFPPAVQAVFAKAVATMKANGAEIIEGLDLPELEALGSAELDILLYDFKHDLNAYLATTPEQVKVKNLNQLIQFNQQHPSTIKYFDQYLIEEAAKKGDITEHRYQEAQALVKKFARQQGIDKIIQEHRLDAFIAPTNTPAWSIDIINGDNFSASSSSPAAIAGYPSITVPMGFHHELPLGISFFAEAYSEAKLIKLAYAFEQLTNARKAPEFKTTLTP